MGLLIFLMNLESSCVSDSQLVLKLNTENIHK